MLLEIVSCIRIRGKGSPATLHTWRKLQEQLYKQAGDTWGSEPNLHSDLAKNVQSSQKQKQKHNRTLLRNICAEQFKQSCGRFIWDQSQMHPHLSSNMLNAIQAQATLKLTTATDTLGIMSCGFNEGRLNVELVHAEAPPGTCTQKATHCA